MKRNRTLAGALALSLICSAFLFSGCSSKPSGSASSPKETSSEGKSTEKKVTLEYYSWGDEDAYMPEIVDAFNAQSASTQVNLTIVPTSGGTEYEDKIVALLASGADMDLFGASTVKLFIKYRDAGNLSDMTDAIQKAGIDLNQYGDDFQSTLKDGKCYALPYRFTAQALFYNKKIFDAEGISYPEQLTWEEYAKLAKQLTKTRDDGTVQWGGFLPTWLGEPIMAVQMGSSVLDEDTGPLKQWLGFLGQIYNEDKSHMSFEEMNSTSTDWLKIFLNGDVALLPNGEWTIGNAQKELKDNPDLAGKCEIGVTYMPLPDSVKDPVTVGGHNTFIMINSRSEKFDNAFEFVQYLTGPEGAEYLVKGGMLPSYSDDSITKLYQETAKLDSTDAFFQTKTRYESEPVAIFSEIDTIWREEKELYLIGEKTLDEAISSFAERREPILNP